MNGPDLVRQVELDTHLYYAEHHADFCNRGYHVMYGPPIERAPILFIGYQPGGDHHTDDHQRPATTGSWPQVAYYATAPWTLARHMRAMFGADLLSQCTGLNAIFFRSPNIAVYQAEVPLARRRQAATFCLDRVQKMTSMLQPSLVVGIGFQTLQLFGPTQPALHNDRGRTLLVAGAIGGIPALASLHLSGARIAAGDRRLIADAVLKRAAC